MQRLRAWSLALAALVVALSATAASASTGRPRTLVASYHTIWAVGQSSSALAWIGGDGVVRMERFGRGKSSVIGKVDPPARSRGSVIAVAGTRALWAFDSGGNSYETSIVVGGLGQNPTGAALLSGGARNLGDGERFGGLAAAGSTFAFGSAVESCPQFPFGLCDLCNPLGSCPLTVVGGGVSVVEPGLKPAAVPSVPPPALLALGENRVAVAPAASPAPESEPLPRVALDGPIEVFDRSGRLLTRIPLQGLVRGLALTGQKVAVLLERFDGSREIRRFDARNGTYLGTSGRLSPAATSLSTGTGGIVFRIGRQICLLRGRTPLPLARAASAPIGLSIVGKRVVWAENVGQHGRIRSVTVR